MSNLVCLNEVKKEKIYANSDIGKRTAKNRYNSRLEERIKRSKSIIENSLNIHKNDEKIISKKESNDKEEINNNQNFKNYEIKNNIINLKFENNKKANSENKYNNFNINMEINKILKKLFLLNNNRPLIDFLNSIYEDNLSLNTKIKYVSDKDKIHENNIYAGNERFLVEKTNYDVEFFAYDENKIFKYNIKFKIINYEKISINIFRYKLKSDNGQNITNNSQNQKTDFSYYDNKISSPKEYTIFIDSDTEIIDTHEIESNNKSISYRLNVLKSWKYDLKQFFEQNIYLLIPLKVFDLRKRLLSIKSQIEILSEQNLKTLDEETKLKALIKDDIFNFFKSINIYFNKAKEKGLIDNKDIHDLNLISINLLTYFKNDLDHIDIDIQEEIKSILQKL